VGLPVSGQCFRLAKVGVNEGRVWSLATVSVRGQSGRERVWPVKRLIGPPGSPQTYGVQQACTRRGR
jgi:hypothetical protein